MRFSAVALAFVVGLAGCTRDQSATDLPMAASVSWGPETPKFNLEVVLRGNGFGLVKFRQPNDDVYIVQLDTWVRGLDPNTSYSLERAVDTTLDGNCTSTTWLRLGQGLSPFPIVTDDAGTGRASLFRAVPPMAGVVFDIHFHVVNTATGAEVLASDCYQYTVSL